MSHEEIIKRIQDKCKFCQECETMWSYVGNPCYGNEAYKLYIQVDKVRYPVRQTVYEFFKKRPRSKEKVLITQCPNKRCMNPDMIKQVNRRDVIVQTIKEGKMHNVTHRAKIEKANAWRNKLTDEQAREIWEAEGANGEIAKRYGVSRQTVNRIKLGQRRISRIDTNPFAGLFTGLSANDEQKRAA